MGQRICSAAECDRKHYARGMCQRHYNHWNRREKEQPREGARMCAFDGCGRRHDARGFCNYHYKQSRYGIAACAVDDCGRPAVKRQWCSGHYNRWREHGDPTAGPPVRARARNGSPNPVTNQLGYRLVWGPEHPNAQRSGYILEHVKIMAETLGRALLPGENVHHLNGVRDDNRPDNLELWVTMQPTGQRPQDLVRYAREILARYA